MKQTNSTGRFTLSLNMNKKENERVSKMLDCLGHKKAVYVSALIERHLKELGITDPSVLDKKKISLVIDDAILKSVFQGSYALSSQMYPPAHMPAALPFSFGAEGHPYEGSAAPSGFKFDIMQNLEHTDAAERTANTFDDSVKVPHAGQTSSEIQDSEGTVEHEISDEHRKMPNDVINLMQNW